MSIGDSHFANVVALLHCDDAAITDASSYAGATVLIGGAAYSSGSGKYGAGKLSVGTNGYVLIINPLFAVGTGDITIEGYCIHSATPSGNLGLFQTILQGNTNGLSASWNTNSWGIYADGGGAYTGSPYTFPSSTWIHWAYVRYSGTASLYIDGVSQVSHADTQNITTNTLYVGNFWSGSNGWPGNMDEIRVSNYARYTANFTPPSAAFADYYAQLTGNITESTAVTNWEVTATTVTGKVNGRTTSGEAGTNYTINCPYADASHIHLSPKVDYAWSASKVVALNDYCVPSSPDTTPRLYKATDIGSSPHQTHSTTEPTWPTSGTVVDNDITWTFVINLDDGLFKTLGTKIPT